MTTPSGPGIHRITDRAAEAPDRHCPAHDETRTATCDKAVKLLTQVVRLAQKYNIKLTAKKNEL